MGYTGRHRAPTPARRPPVRLLLGSIAVVAVAASMAGWNTTGASSAPAPAPEPQYQPAAPPTVQGRTLMAPEAAAAPDEDEVAAQQARTRASRSQEGRAEVTWATAQADPAVQMCGSVIEATGYSNGQLPSEALCELPQPGHYLVPEAAVAWARLAEAYAEHFGTDVCITDSYRSLPEQVVLHRTKKDLAAVPGTSNHGWGLALDLCGGAESFDSAEYAWLTEHGPTYGWENPDWAHDGTGREEPWHWEHEAVRTG